MSENYREAMISKFFFFKFWSTLLPEISGKAQLSTCQCAYRENISTLDAVTVLKEEAHKYTSEG